MMGCRILGHIFISEVVTAASIVDSVTRTLASVKFSLFSV
jgi:hypothetical protein